MLAVETAWERAYEKGFPIGTLTSPPISCIGILNESLTVSSGPEMKQIENHSPRFL